MKGKRSVRNRTTTRLGLALLATCLVVCGAGTSVLGASLVECPGGGYGTNIIPILEGNPDFTPLADDGSFHVTDLTGVFPGGIQFPGDIDPETSVARVYTELWVNVNGNVTFDDWNLTYTPEFIPFPTGNGYPIIAPWYADVDLRRAGGGLAGFWYCADSENQRIIITWEEVGYYSYGDDLRNSFQLVLQNIGEECSTTPGIAVGVDIEFRYSQLEWIVGSASGGTDGLCPLPFDPPWPGSGGTGECYPAVAGFDIGDGLYAVRLPESGYPEVVDVVDRSNVEEPGVWRWRILPTCGDGVEDLCEECDDGDDINDNECTNACTINFCGDGYVSAALGEICDGVNLGEVSSLCTDYDQSFTGGYVRCNDTCDGYDLSNCEPIRWCYSDEDGDGYTGTPHAILANEECEDFGGDNPWSDTDDGDCADDPEDPCALVSYPGGEEICDGCDNDCDGGADEEDPEGCGDVDECAEGTDNCSANATCTNTADGYTCTCNQGYTGDGVICIDINECAEGTDNCSSNATCTNTEGGFVCTCNQGYTGDGVVCTDIDECALGTDNCDPNATCTNTEGGFTCTCNQGYLGDGVTCTIADRDGDGILDADDNCPDVYNPGQENNYGTDLGDACEDIDGDGLYDAEEDLNGNGVLDPDETDPTRADTDGDGLSDYTEVRGDNPTNPGSPDTDGDSLCDGPTSVSEVCLAGEDTNANGRVDPGETDPTRADTDEGGVPDGEEVQRGTDPLNPQDDIVQLQGGSVLGCSTTSGAAPSGLLLVVLGGLAAVVARRRRQG
ncbi:MAG: hypothetical protein JW797_02375 [Bradymonadales bacterium]|nr:hypothetical protein [Bradymonadales bacterium]